MSWSSKSLGSRLQHEIFYFLVRCHLLVLAKALLICVVAYYATLPSIQRRAMPYLCRRFPQARGFTRWRHCFRLYYCFAQGLLDRTIVGILGESHLQTDTTMQQKFYQCIPQDTGCIILTAHIGVWQMAIAGIEPLQRRINIVQWLHPEDRDRHYFQHKQHTNAQHFRIINSQEDADTTLQIITALRHNELVCIAGDRITSPAEPYATATFMGGTIRIPATAFLLASIAQVPIVAAFTIRNNGILQGVLIEKMHIAPNVRRNPQLLHGYAQQFADMMQYMVDNYPYNFFNFYDIWSHDDSTGMPRQAQTMPHRHPQS